jgi:phage terminase large subunit-like protein
LITITPGRTTDYAIVRAGVNEIANRYGIQQIGYDPYNADQLARQLSEGDGFEMVIIRQGFISMSEPSKLLDKLILDTNIHHDGNPVLRSHAENAAIRRDPSGNIKPDKDSATGRIDGIVALVMALRLASLDTNDDTFTQEGPMVVSW